MKALIRLLVFGALFFLLAATNPDREAHQTAIVNKLRKQSENDPLRQVGTLLHDLQENLGISPFTYHDYQFLSIMKNEDGDNITLGIARRVYVLQNPAN